LIARCSGSRVAGVGPAHDRRQFTSRVDTTRPTQQVTGERIVTDRDVVRLTAMVEARHRLTTDPHPWAGPANHHHHVDTPYAMERARPCVTSASTTSATAATPPAIFDA